MKVVRNSVGSGVSGCSPIGSCTSKGVRRTLVFLLLRRITYFPHAYGIPFATNCFTWYIRLIYTLAWSPIIDFPLMAPTSIRLLVQGRILTPSIFLVSNCAAESLFSLRRGKTFHKCQIATSSQPQEDSQEIT